MGSLCAAAAVNAPGAARAASAAATPRRIAVEEGYNIPELAKAAPTWVAQHRAQEPGEAGVFHIGATPPPPGSTPPEPPFMRKLLDLGEGRIRDMDAAGISMQVLLLSSPGVQLFDAAQAAEYATLANDRAAAAVKAHPDRFAALAAIAPQDPRGAALELERAVHRLGFRGAVINSHTHGEYLDDPKFAPILEAAQALDVPIYIHPRAPSPQVVAPYVEYGLEGAIWGYAVETSLHALRLIFSGAFDRYPRLRIVIGHMGEAIPFYLDRLDTHYGVGGGRGPRSARLERKPSEYFKDHFVITTSGVNWAPALKLSLEVLGADRILFAADYPFEDAKLAVDNLAKMDLSPADRAKIEYQNAERVFGLRSTAGATHGGH